MNIFIPIYVLDIMAKVANEVSSETKIEEIAIENIYDVYVNLLDKSECNKNDIKLTNEELISKFEEIKQCMKNTSNKVVLCNEYGSSINEPYDTIYNPYTIGFRITNNENMPPSIIIENIFHLLKDIKLIKHIGPISTKFGLDDDIYVKHEYQIILNFTGMKVIG